MSNSIDCSSLFALPDPADVTLEPAVGSKNGDYIVKDLKTDSVIWIGSLAQCEQMRTSYIENGV